jgi:hypothetical protein
MIWLAPFLGVAERQLIPPRPTVNQLMITNLELTGVRFEHGLSTPTIQVGDTLRLIASEDSPLTVQIGCFVDQPPPPRFTGCAECQLHRVQSER